LADIEPLKDITPLQISFLETKERGDALALIVSYGGTPALPGITYTKDGPQTKFLGTSPKMKLAATRKLAHMHWGRPEKGATQAKVGSFKKVAQDRLEQHVEANHLRSEQEIKRILNKYVYPKLGSVDFFKITQEQISDLTFAISKDHGKPQADAALAQIRAVM